MLLCTTSTATLVSAAKKVDRIRGMDVKDAYKNALERYSMRVTNGTTVPQGGGSAFVRILFEYENGYGLCGGTIVNPTTVLTAGHCAYDRHTGQVKAAESINIFYGNVLTSNNNYIKPSQVILHPKYDSYSLENDIAILRIPRLNMKMGFTESLALYNGSIRPIQPMAIYGWGITSTYGYDEPVSLLTQTVYISEPDKCHVILPKYSSADGPQICVNNNYNVGVDVCSGDSGTGTTIQANNNVEYLAGLVSFGTDVNGDFTCGEKGSFGVYTNVYYYRNWIESIIGTTLAVGP
ncbi:hypothetical protein J3B02_000970 [Coemansia erecta]|uniref:Peptidase S1 domain-containing protein n=1 Tax=Coemansia asiatica TaxID=1052880 RepID=A0A9W8CGJ2_9FUNG|nr:hypothetical protein LPJ64_005891 [Coemansia asiatica]KAJ2857478.1 hypothetical protein J3B02_000970 [Coemansia erecta]